MAHEVVKEFDKRSCMYILVDYPKVKRKST